MLFLACMFINAAIYMQYLAVLPLHMKSEGLSTWWFSAVVALNGFIVITCELLVTKVVQHWPARIVAMIGFVLLGGGLAFYALPGGIAIFVIGTLLWTLAEIIAGPTMFAYPGMAAPPKLLGRYVGSAHAMFGLGSALGPFLGVWVWNSAGTRGLGLVRSRRCDRHRPRVLRDVRHRHGRRTRSGHHPGVRAIAERERLGGGRHG